MLPHLALRQFRLLPRRRRVVASASSAHPEAQGRTRTRTQAAAGRLREEPVPLVKPTFRQTVRIANVLKYRRAHLQNGNANKGWRRPTPGCGKKFRKVASLSKPQ